MTQPAVTFLVPLARNRSASTPFDASLLQQLDPRVEVVVVHQDISDSFTDAVNRGLAIAEGRYVCVLDPDAVLLADGLPDFLHALEGDADIVYSDEILDGVRFFKPAFSPERLRSQNYFGAAVAYRRDRVLELGGLRSGIDGSALYDLALRLSRASKSATQVASPIVATGSTPLEVQWGARPEQVASSTRQVLEEHLAATGGGHVSGIGADGIHRTRRDVVGEPLVSIVIPTRGTYAEVRGDRRCLVVEAVRSVVNATTYPNFELVIVIDDVAEVDVRQELREIGGDALRFVEWDRPFSFSEKMNLGVLHARGEFVILLNDDIELITPGWIEPMLALAQLPDAGLVGCMLYFDDDSIQHAGHAYYRLDISHIGMHSERGAAGPNGGFLVEREIAGVTCACALMRRSLFIEAGGFSTRLPGNFNDVDLCLKVSALGYQSYWTPYAELYHFESKSRDPRVARPEINVAWGRWEHLLWDSALWPMDPHEVFRRHDS